MVCTSLLLVAALLLRDLLLFSEDDLGGGAGSGLSRTVLLAFLPVLSPPVAKGTFEEDAGG